MNSLQRFIRPNILNAKPYSSARDEYSGSAAIFLDANENPFNDPLNRYPDPHQKELKKKIAVLKNVPVDSVFLGNGSDEAIDLIIRASCEPGFHKIISIDPSYGMYEVAANVNNCEFIKVPLNPDFGLNSSAILQSVDTSVRLIFLCSPNNPTSNNLHPDEIISIIKNFDGLVVLDEAYVDFSDFTSFLPQLSQYPNLIVLQTLSKAWGMAGIRLGMAFAHPFIISVLDKIKYPYNISTLTQQAAMKALENKAQFEIWRKTIRLERKILMKELNQIKGILKVYPSDANFILIQVKSPKDLYQWLVKNSLIIRDRSSLTHCSGCLRITIGSPEENKTLIQALRKYWNEN